MAHEVRGGCHASHRHFGADRLVRGASLANLSCCTSPGFLSKALFGEKNDGMRCRPAHNPLSRGAGFAVPGHDPFSTIILAVPGHDPLPTVKGDDVMLCLDCDDVMF